jgi:hypothetical protein
VRELESLSPLERAPASAMALERPKERASKASQPALDPLEFHRVPRVQDT